MLVSTVITLCKSLAAYLALEQALECVEQTHTIHLWIHIIVAHSHHFGIRK